MNAEEVKAKLKALKQISFLRGDTLDELVRGAGIVAYPAGSAISEGADGRSFVFLVSGRVSLWVEYRGIEVKTTILEAPDYFGALMLVAPSERKLSIRAEDDATLCVCGRDAFFHHLYSVPDVRKDILKRIEEQRRRTESILKGKSRHDGPSGRKDDPALPGHKGQTRASSGGAQEKHQHKSGIKRGAGLKKSPEGPLPLRSAIIFTLQFAILLKAGIPAIAALNTIASTSDRRLSSLTRDILLLVEQGHSLSEALSKKRGTFSPLMINMVKMSEHTGRLAESMSELSSYLSREEQKRAQMTQALVYPMCILAFSLLMVAFLVFYMLPNFMVAFAGSGAETPRATALLMQLMHDRRPFIYGTIFIAAAAMLVVPYFRTPVGRACGQMLLYEAPLLKGLFLYPLLTRFSRSLAMLLSGSSTLVSALQVLGSDSTGYYRLDEAIDQMVYVLKNQGSTLTEAMAESGFFPRIMGTMIAAGEESGEVVAMLVQYADLQDVQNELAVSDFMKVLEPLMLLFMGFVVGFIVLAAFLPIFQLVRAV
ncbi:MAG: type II secretion system F family protein [Candidatus Eremiobacteraeota bacterium]|nr:type II secretion system F family protein [Candidatus Eremiobacteraeota bacterium]